MLTNGINTNDIGHGNGNGRTRFAFCWVVGLLGTRGETSCRRHFALERMSMGMMKGRFVPGIRRGGRQYRGQGRENQLGSIAIIIYILISKAPNREAAAPFVGILPTAHDTIHFLYVTKLWLVGLGRPPHTLHRIIRKYPLETGAHKETYSLTDSHIGWTNHSIRGQHLTKIA